MGTSCFFKGILDEFAIYNYARTAEEIWIDYKSGVGTIFEDDFESYTVGTFPSPPWQMWFSGKGAAEQRIVDTEHVSGSKSLRLWGANGWGAVAATPITFTGDTIGYEVMVKAENWGLYPSTKTGAIIGFGYKISGSLWTYWARVIFQSDGYIRGYDVTPIQSYNLDTWYKVKTIFTISSREYSVWINDEFKGTFMDTNSYDPSQIEAFAVASDHAEQICYFDDVKVFVPSAVEEIPIAILSASPTTVDIGEDVTFDASSSYDPDGTVEYYWFDYGDSSDSGWISSSTTAHSYTESGVYCAKVKVKDNDGLESEWSEIVEITVPRQLSIELSGEHDYLPWENVKVKIAALVADVNTMEPVSDANVTITVYDPENNLWINDTMTEKLNTGIYLWESTETVREIFRHHGKGIHVVHGEASFNDGPTASDILTFHIDPPPEDKDNQLPIIIGISLAAITVIALAAVFIKKKRKL